MKSRLAHLAMLALGAAAVVLTFLGSIPKYAGLAGSALLLVTDLRKALAPTVDVPAKVVALLLLCAFPLTGCATVNPVVKACAPAKTDESQAVVNLLNDPSRTEAEIIAILEGGKILACVVTEIARDVMQKEAESTPKLATSMHAPVEMSLQAMRAAAWLKKHP